MRHARHRWPGTIAATLVLAALLYIGATPLGPAPPLGGFLDPVQGVWGVARSAELPAQAEGTVAGLDGEVRVTYDRRGVPHIFATSVPDAYRALGYVVARDRLFQLEMTTRAAAGTLTEVAGARAIDADREMRMLGLPWAARRKFAALDTAAPAGQAIAAYTAGINAWIDAMRPADVPLEFRLLDARPSRWEPVNVIHLLNRMGWTLSYATAELNQERAAALVGRTAAAAVYPLDAPLQEPIVPDARRGPGLDERPLPPPGAPDEAALASGRSAGAFVPAREGGDVIGSNSWAVAPARSASGHALLAGDPHLDMTLPSLWYEAHLVVPGALDVYGATIVGSPWVVIGFNRDVAWTFTNAGTDAIDYYAETVDDSASPGRYMVDGEWRPIERSIEAYLGPRGDTVGLDTLRLTHRGPMRRERGRWLSMRWTLLEPSTEADAIHALASATSASDWLAAMNRFLVPPQNALVADRSGTIAIRSNGRVPIRPDALGGSIVRDGASAASDWQGDLGIARYPAAMNPSQGFLASANQQPRTPGHDGPYVGHAWPPPWRAIRINTLLRADSSVTPDDMRRFQTDPGSARADRFVPLLLEAARSELAAGRGDSTLGTASALLAGWDRRYTRENQRAVLFEAAMRELRARTWDELRAAGDGAARGPWPPDDAVLLRLAADPESPWWDDRSTSGMRETRDGIIAASLAAALTTVLAEHGAPDAGGWRWSRIRHANIRHLLGLPALSALDIPVQGGPSTLSPSSGGGGFGASWRMVVELGPEIRAWATYPGGQSGNPVSARYRSNLPRWSSGELDSIALPREPDGLPAEAVRSRLTLRPRR